MDADTDTSGGRSRESGARLGLRHGRRAIFAGIGLVALASAAAISWFVGVEVGRSRAPQIAASEGGPATVPVESRPLRDSAVFRGTVVDAGLRTVTVPSSAADSVPLVTALPVEQGDTVGEGDLVVEVSGRPVFVLDGALAAFRDMRPSDSGPDIGQLQDALARLGLYSGPIDGDFGPATQDAVRKLYQEAGYEAPQTSETLAADREEADRQVQDAADQLAAAQRALSRSRDDAATAVQTAREGLDAAHRGLRSAQHQADSMVEEAELALAAARKHEREVNNDPDADEQSRREARAAVVSAENALEQARLDADDLVSSARDAVAQAERALDTAEDTTTFEAEQAVESAQRALADARRRRRDLDIEQGVMIPRGEVVFVASLPGTVTTVETALGERPADESGGGEQQPDGGGSAGALLTVASDTPTVQATAPAEVVPNLEPGQDATVTDEATGSGYAAAVASVATDEDPMGGHAVTLTFPDEVPQGLIGTNVRVDVDFDLSEPVTVVPMIAVWTDAGISYVTVIDDGNERDVQVELGASAGGLVEIVDADGGLDESDMVVVAR